MRTISRLFPLTFTIAAALMLGGCLSAKEAPDKAEMKAAEPAAETVTTQQAPVVVDTDGDGVPDDSDECPGTPAGTVVGANGCEADDDGDGVPNSLDQCPNTPAGATVNRAGCAIIASLEGVNFEFDSAELTEQGRATLDQAAKVIADHPTSTIEVAGHTDSVGSEEYNQGLSERRADSVRSYLINTGGIAGTRLRTIGYGESQPVATNDTEEGRAANRRVDMVDASR